MCDLETGGLDEKTHAIVQVAFILFNNERREIMRFSAIVRELLFHVDEEALRINGVQRADIETAVSASIVLDYLKELTNTGVIWVFHNAPFDVGFLNKRGFNITRAIDTLSLDKQIRPHAHSHKLSAACEAHDIPVANAHNALGDSVMCANLWKKCIKILGQKALIAEEVKENK